MEISPIKIFYMTVASLGFGMLMGMFNDLNRFMRMLLGEEYGNRRPKFLSYIRLPLSRRSMEEAHMGRMGDKILNVVILVQDVFLFAVSGVGVAILNYYFNNGRARIYTPFAVIFGFAIYYFTFGNIALRFLYIIAYIVKFIILSIFETFYYIIGFFANIFGFFVKKLYTNLCKTIAKKQKKVYNNNKEKYVMNNASLGFVNITKE